MKPKINEEIDAENIRIFEKTGMNNPNEYRYRCVLCGQEISIGNSISEQGHRMICNRCVCHKFPSVLAAFDWVNKGE